MPKEVFARDAVSGSTVVLKNRSLSRHAKLRLLKVFAKLPAEARTIEVDERKKDWLLGLQQKAAANFMDGHKTINACILSVFSFTVYSPRGRHSPALLADSYLIVAWNRCAQRPAQFVDNTGKITSFIYAIYFSGWVGCFLQSRYSKATTFSFRPSASLVLVSTLLRNTKAFRSVFRDYSILPCDSQFRTILWRCGVTIIFIVDQ